MWHAEGFDDDGGGVGDGYGSGDLVVVMVVVVMVVTLVVVVLATVVVAWIWFCNPTSLAHLMLDSVWPDIASNALPWCFRDVSAFLLSQLAFISYHRIALPLNIENTLTKLDLSDLCILHALLAVKLHECQATEVLQVPITGLREKPSGSSQKAEVVQR